MIGLTVVFKAIDSEGFIVAISMSDSLDFEKKFLILDY